MFWIGLFMFAVYSGLLVVDEFWFHRKRGLVARERHTQPLTHLSIAASVALLLFVPYGSGVRLIFGALTFLSCALLTKDEFVHAKHCTGGEQTVHAALFMIHPLMMILTLAIWPFIDGAGLITGLVLPFSTSHLRPLCWGYFGFLAIFSAYEGIYWNLGRKAVPVVEAEHEIQPERRSA